MIDANSFGINIPELVVAVGGVLLTGGMSILVSVVIGRKYKQTYAELVSERADELQKLADIRKEELEDLIKKYEAGTRKLVIDYEAKIKNLEDRLMTIQRLNESLQIANNNLIAANQELVTRNSRLATENHSMLEKISALQLEVKSLREDADAGVVQRLKIEEQVDQLSKHTR